MGSNRKTSDRLEATDVATFLQHVRKIHDRPGWFRNKDGLWWPWFRGQENADCDLRPQLYRERNFAQVRKENVEYEMREEFIKRAPILCETLPGGSERRAEWEWYFIMQHFGMATRLLDWTEGALTGLYFAVRHHVGDKDAAVWVLDPYALNKSAIGKEWVIPPSATGVYKDKWAKKIEKWLPKRFTDMKRLPSGPVAIDPTHVVRRISSQHSCFTIHGRDEHGLDRLQSKKNSCLVKIVILKSGIDDIRKHLRTCGINEATIFPDLDGLGRAINAKWATEKKQKRVVPHNRVYARIRKSHIHGVGVFAIRNIPKGTEIFAEDNSELVWKKRSDLKLNKLPAEIRQLYNQFCIIKDKGEKYGCPASFNQMTVAWYLNHSKTPNTGCDEDYKFFALRNIRRGEELTADYRTYNEFKDTAWI